jgi:hypothetical protein
MKRAMNRQEYEAIAIPHQARVGVKLSPDVSLATASLLIMGCARILFLATLYCLKLEMLPVS